MLNIFTICCQPRENSKSEQLLEGKKKILSLVQFSKICNFTTYMLIYVPFRCNRISVIRSYLAWPNKAFY